MRVYECWWNLPLLEQPDWCSFKWRVIFEHPDLCCCSCRASSNVGFCFVFFCSHEPVLTAWNYHGFMIAAPKMCYFEMSERKLFYLQTTHRICGTFSEPASFSTLHTTWGIPAISWEGSSYCGNTTTENISGFESVTFSDHRIPWNQQRVRD